MGSTAASDTTLLELQSDVASALKQISGSFIEDSFRDNLLFSGTRDAISSTATSYFNEAKVMTNIADETCGNFVPILMRKYDEASIGFKAQFGGDITNTSAANFKYRDLQKSSVTYNETALVKEKPSLSQYITNKTEAKNTEVSLSSYVNRDSKLGRILNNMRLLYSALDDQNYRNYVYNLTAKPKQLQNVRLVDYWGNPQTNNEQNMETLKNIISSLRSTNSSTTKNIISTITKPNMTVEEIDLSLPSNSNINPPKETNGDNMVLIFPKTNTSPSSVTIANIAMLQGGSAKKPIVTYSFYAKVRENVGDMTSANILIRMALEDDGSPPVSIRNTRIQFSSDLAGTVTTQWRRFVIQRSDLDLPENTKVKVSAMIYIDHNNGSTATNQKILITGVQANVQSEDEAGILPAFQPPMFDDSKTNRVVVRRLLLMYELIATYYIAIYLLESNFTINDLKEKYTSLLNIVYEYMTNFNRNVIRNVPGDSATSTSLLGKLGQDVSSRFTEYQKNNTDLMSQTSKLKDNQYDLKDRISGMNSEKDKMSKTYTFMIVSLVIFSIVALACLVIFALPIDRGQQVTAAIGVGAIGIITALVFYWIYTYKVEEFQSSSNLLSNPAAMRYATQISNQDTLKSEATSVALAFASDYLDNTINIALMIQTYVGYGNINQALNKERVYFDGVNKQLSNAGYKVKSVANAYAQDKFTNRARVTFLVSVTILVALAAVLLITLNKYPYATPIILTLSAVMLFLCILFYLLDTSARVRTSASKIYWGAPNTSTLY